MKKLYFLIAFYAFLGCEMEQPDPIIITKTDTLIIKETHTDTVYITETQTDTVEIVVHKNVYIDVAGDSVLVTDTVFITVIETKTVIQKDTVFLETTKTDTVYITQTDTVYIEKDPVESFKYYCTEKDKYSTFDEMEENFFKGTWSAYAKNEKGELVGYHMHGGFNPDIGKDLEQHSMTFFKSERDKQDNLQSEEILYNSPFWMDRYDVKLSVNLEYDGGYWYNPMGFTFDCMNENYFKWSNSDLVLHFYKEKDIESYKVNRFDLILNSYTDIDNLVNYVIE